MRKRKIIDAWDLLGPVFGVVRNDPQFPWIKRPEKEWYIYVAEWFGFVSERAEPRWAYEKKKNN